MLLAAGPLASLTDLLQIICWIVLPVLFLTFIGTITHHFFRKKKNASQGLDTDAMLNLTSHNNSNKAAYLYFDHSGVIKKYQQQLTYSHARYAALRNDFEQLEKKLTRAPRSKLNQHLSNKKNNMENTFDQMPVVQTETKEAGDLTGISQIDYLKDLLEEKSSQVGFLQSQLEQRIRKQHEAEYNLGEKEKELIRNLDLVGIKEQQLVYSEGQLSELRQQNELLNASAADSLEKLDILGRQLEEEKGRAIAMEEKLNANKQLLQRLYREFSACMEGEAPVVVNMRPTYLSNVAEE
jgi:hypothetical protein